MLRLLVHWGGQAAAIAAWLITTYVMFGELTITTTAKNGPSLAGNIVAIAVSTLVVVIWTYVRPDHSCTFADLRAKLEDKVKVLDGAKVIDWEKEDPEGMKKAYKWTWVWAGSISTLVFAIWPLLTLPAGVFSLGYFSFWVALSLAWGSAAALVVVFYPLAESSHILKNVVLCRPYAKTHPPTADAPSPDLIKPTAVGGDEIVVEAIGEPVDQAVSRT